MREYCKNCKKLQDVIDVKNSLYQKMADNFMTAHTESKRYKQALEEIEGIVNKKTEIPICDECAYRNIPECKENCMQDVLGEILDIISKAKGEEK